MTRYPDAHYSTFVTVTGEMMSWEKSSLEVSKVTVLLQSEQNQNQRIYIIYLILRKKSISSAQSGGRFHLDSANWECVG